MSLVLSARCLERISRRVLWSVILVWSAAGASLTPLRANDAETPTKGDESNVGTLRGMLKFVGERPKLPALPIVRDVQAFGSTEAPDESLLIGDKGGLANVVVYLPQAPLLWQPTAPPKEPAQIEFRNGKFLPRLTSLRVGQSLQLKNLMPVATNFHASPLRAAGFNVITHAGGTQRIEAKTMLAEKFPFRVNSDIYPWLQSWILVLDHPFVAITDREGRFEMAGLPPGAHEFRVWHERGGYLEKQLPVQVTAGQTTELTLEYRYDAERSRLTSHR